MSLVSTYSGASIRAWEGFQNTWTQIQVLTGFVGSLSSVASSQNGDYIVTGSTGTGAQIYFKSGSTWSLQQTINGSGSQYVAMNDAGDVVVKGSNIWTRSGTTWTNVQTLSSGTNTPISISPTGDYIGIGPEIYYRSGGIWSLQQTLGVGFTNGVGVLTEDYYFVSNVAYSSSSGITYVYKRAGTTWSLEASLVASDSSSGAGFGTSIAVNQTADAILIGAPAKNINKGKVYYFTRSGTTWTETQSFVPPTGGSSDYRFGQSISMNGNGTNAIIGAPAWEPSGFTNNYGASYYYQLFPSGWQEVQQLNSTPLVVSNQFGSGVDTTNLGSYLFIVSNGGYLYIFSN